MQLTITPHALKQLRKLPRALSSRIAVKIDQLGENPYPAQSKKLSGREGYRLRIGDFRIIYLVGKKRKSIKILEILPRDKAY